VGGKVLLPVSRKKALAYKKLNNLLVFISKSVVDYPVYFFLMSTN